MAVHNVILDCDWFILGSHQLTKQLADLMEELCNDKKSSTLFTRDRRHKNVTVFFIVQNLFKQGNSMRDIALN